MWNSSFQKPGPISVSCHSGRSYAERPTSFVCNRERYEIILIEQEWFEPGEKHFIVQATGAEMQQDEMRFEICYDTLEDIWQLKEIR